MRRFISGMLALLLMACGGGCGTAGDPRLLPSAAIRAACPGMADTAISSYLDAIEAHRLDGGTESDALSDLIEGCTETCDSLSPPGTAENQSCKVLCVVCPPALTAQVYGH